MRLAVKCVGDCHAIFFICYDIAHTHPPTYLPRPFSNLFLPSSSRYSKDVRVVYGLLVGTKTWFVTKLNEDVRRQAKNAYKQAKPFPHHRRTHFLPPFALSPPPLRAPREDDDPFSPPPPEKNACLFYYFLR